LGGFRGRGSGNGISLENHIGRFVADAEAIFSYESTREMNTLIVGEAITGLSAFVCRQALARSTDGLLPSGF
jgi:alkylation response protein AidB-like acyl-CoA dehydrogenase